MYRCTWLGTTGSRMGTGKPANIAGRGEPPAAWSDAAVPPDPGLCAERAGCLLLDHIIQRGGRATQSLQGQEAIREEAHGGVVVEARPGASLEVIQAQLLFELLITLLHVPAALPQLNRVHQRRLR